MLRSRRPPRRGVSERPPTARATVTAELPISCNALPPQQLLPFFLAARSAISPGQDLLGEALCSSYEAFRFTRKNRDAAKDEQDESSVTTADLSHSRWYLGEFDRALEHVSGFIHPKICATVRTVVDLWEAGEKVLVFAFYRRSCRALGLHISREIERRVMATGQRRLEESGQQVGAEEIAQRLARIQRRYFDDTDSPGRRAIDAALSGIVQSHAAALEKVAMSEQQYVALTNVLRRFLRVPTTLVRCFPLAELDSIQPIEVVTRAMNHVDSSGISWLQKFNGFVAFLTEGCSAEERRLYLEAGMETRTGSIRMEDEDADGGPGRLTLANVRVATGKTPNETRARLMRAFNTPFFPDVLVCSQVMGEGVDLQRFCRHVIHHDLDWNPSTIEQRTGRVDRLGCKAEGRQPVVIYLPYLAGTADERRYRVMSDREQWFRIVMGQDEVAQLIKPESSSAMRLPEAISTELSFRLGIADSSS